MNTHEVYEVETGAVVACGSMVSLHNEGLLNPSAEKIAEISEYLGHEVGELAIRENHEL